MYWVDTTIVVLVLIGAAFGLLSGFLWQVSRIVSFGLALYASIYCHDWASGVLTAAFFRDADPRVPRVLAFPIVFLTVYLVLFLITLLLERSMKAARLEPVNRLVGALLGAVKTALILGTLCLAMANYPSPRTEEIMERSVLAPALADVSNLVIIAIPEEYKKELQSGLIHLREAARNKIRLLRTGNNPPAP
jgi:membrane protein required for colicin V production